MVGSNNEVHSDNGVDQTTVQDGVGALDHGHFLRRISSFIIFLKLFIHITVIKSRFYSRVTVGIPCKHRIPRVVRAPQ